MKSGNSPEVIHKDVVIIGNGPSGLALSYMLSGNVPYLISSSHPDELLSARLKNMDTSNLIRQDLIELASDLEGRSINPISILLDALIHPYADVGLELNSLITWKKNGIEIDHVVLGKGSPGGSWHEMDPNILTLSLGTWMALPGLPYRARDGSEKRASAGNVAKYYSQYVKEMQLEKYFQSGMSVTKITRLNANTEQIVINQAETEMRKQTFCPLSNAFNFIRFRSNRSCKRRRDSLTQNDSSPDRKIREVLLSPSSSENRANRTISSSKDVEDVPQSIDLCYTFSISRSMDFSCDCDNFKSSCDSFCGNVFKKQGSFINPIKSSCSLDLTNSISKVPRTLSICDNDPFRLKENCDASTSRVSVNKPNWLVEVHDATTGNDLKYSCNNLVLANGISDLPNKLAISETGENPSWLVHDVRSLELALDLYVSKNPYNPDPVIVVGAGLSAADAIIATRCRNIPVLHVFRKKHVNLGKQLPENMYPEYHKVHQMMQDGGSTYPLYTALPESSITDINVIKRTVTVTTKFNEELKFPVSFAAVLIGTRPDLSFLPGSYKLGVHKNLPIDNKTNVIDINKSNYSVNGFEHLYAMGPLAGDNFVRFIPGGGLAIVADLYKKNGY
ncbi:hypothetical protein FQR65_LT11501 [Abscondita terminalis]|nr:hypothetical protein FQR65_LT11501 [Abscondita terminalis]